MPLAAELPDVQLPAGPSRSRGHRRRGVVRPDDDPRPRVMAVEVGEQPVERVRHVTVAQVPRGLGPVEHAAVVLLRVEHEPGVLLGVELLVLGGEPISAQVVRRPALKLQQLAHHPLAAGLGDAARDRMAVRLALLEALEAAIAEPRAALLPAGRPPRGRRSRPRSSGRGCRGRARRTPRDAPRARCGRGASPRGRACRRSATSTWESAGSRRASARHRDHRPAPRIQRLTRYASGQSASTATAVKQCSSIRRFVIKARCAVELVGAVGGLAEEHQPRAADEPEELVVVAGRACQRPGSSAERGVQHGHATNPRSPPASRHPYFAAAGGGESTDAGTCPGPRVRPHDCARGRSCPRTRAGCHQAIGAPPVRGRIGQ